MEDVDWGCDDEEIQEYFEDFEGVTLAAAAPQESAAGSADTQVFVLPGAELANCRLSKLSSGTGSYRQGDSIIASIAGIRKEQDGVISVVPVSGDVKGREGPRPGSIVLARVVRVTPRHVTCDIFVVDGVIQTNCCRGHIRPTDVLPILLDRTSLLDCFRPGDIVRAQVIATGVSRNFLLSTVAPEFGVIKGLDEKSGEPLEHFASRLMRCPTSNTLVWRKAALPDAPTL
eukprot:Gregarina_sp_Pseudo_9__1765@NODE_21_length_5816_cov_43_641856_g19_i0_p3_GENE_NODE_21_length_5816_cov_43_641856_g19_i0NODE_21_length_5816_cov_43_641856_g19_i0_p3_ORF_typecomplete_len230_score26_67EXOSC1/PF10447_9/1e03EXOSC1/PF10447_9/5_2e18S1/PF00575_23/1_3e02S1/PF00575_23/0_035ECR1_N/PF14382_6/0_0093_NODE_21_length_5816_cov_43_641856_g19_i06671356